MKHKRKGFSLRQALSVVNRTMLDRLPALPGQTTLFDRVNKGRTIEDAVSHPAARGDTVRPTNTTTNTKGVSHSIRT